MGDIAIRVENLSKRYKIGTKQPYHRFSEFLTGMGQRAIRWPAKALRGSASSHDAAASDDEDFWALRDVSFDVNQGEVIGIIGRNGAGKSTLLKILSRITEPTSGRFGIQGRVGSLLEVGTGFHPELTGRENIHLCATVLGMTRREVSASFDEIVDFSGVEQFIDTPVKRYSSGMQVRLGFAVAAHLKPEVLIVDEVLAVGDAEFQKKCLGKLQTVAEGGRTVLFVSHHLGLLRSICDKALLLERGEARSYGPAHDVILAYAESLRSSRDQIDRQILAIPEDPHIRLISVALSQNEVPLDVFTNGDPIDIEITCEIRKSRKELRVFFSLYDMYGGLVFIAFHDAVKPVVLSNGPWKLAARIPANLLAPMAYTIRFGATIFGSHSCTGDHVEVPLVVQKDGAVDNSQNFNVELGVVWPEISWQLHSEKVTT